uniref:Golgi reassembly-stacking protein 1 isoform X3 n=1 Tax=Odobenus rosmarus divergens TaxID=9708 RepID=UPI00063C6F71|nr:PREDICTED: Golgi reassembly-stacking protein 1 isoform X3 [Odobenus rosmarus divergens]
MGLGASAEQPAGGAEGFHLHGDVEPSSPASLAGLRPYTDYVVGSDQILQEPPSHHKKPLDAPPPGAPPPDALPPDVPPPGPTPQDSPAPPGPEIGSRQDDYMEALLQAPGSFMEGQLSEPGSPSHGAADLGGFPRPMEIPLQPPPPVQRVMDPGFLAVSGLSLSESSSAGVRPSLPSATELTRTAHSASGPEDVSSCGSHERGGEATWSGSEFEVSFPDSPGTQAQPDHLPQLTLPDSLTSAASPEDGLSAELLEAQAEEPASTESPDFEAEAEEAASQTQVSTPE